LLAQKIEEEAKKRNDTSNMMWEKGMNLLMAGTERALNSRAKRNAKRKGKPYDYEAHNKKKQEDIASLMKGTVDFTLTAT